MRFRTLVSGAAIAIAVSAVASGAHALTYVEDLYTLSNATMGGTYSGVTASGTEGYVYYSNGQDYIVQDITIHEDLGGTNYTYNLVQNCLSIAPNCGLNVITEHSQIPGLGSFVIDFNIDFYAFNYPSSVVPVSFEDVIYPASGNGTLSETIIHGSTAPEPATWALMAAGVFGLGAGLRRRRRGAAAAG